MESNDQVCLWRLVKTPYASSAFDGEGAFRFGGRWNHRGQRVVYTSGTLSLAMLEILVHLDPAAHLPAMCAVAIHVPRSQIHSTSFSSLTAISGGLPWGRSQTRNWGQTWFEAQTSVALKVPSALVPHESNYIINPLHPAFKTCTIEAARPFSVDARFAL
jgi:RES domain-containing protein